MFTENLIAADIQKGRPFSTTAAVSGRCREVDIPSKSFKNKKWMYRLEAGKDGKDNLNKVGLLYLDYSGEASVCFDDLGLAPFIEKNVKGEKVSISGYITSSSGYKIDKDVANQAEILLVESIKLIEE